MLYNIIKKKEGKMEKKFNKKFAIIPLGILVLGCIAYLPIHRANKIKSTLHKIRYKQIKFLNSQSNIIPEIINSIKGYIIHDEIALKDIVLINALIQNNNKNISDIYENQLRIYSITQKLITEAQNNSLLNNNENFNKLKTRFSEIYTTIQDDFELCKKYTNDYAYYATLPIYKHLINTKNIDEINCK